MRKSMILLAVAMTVLGCAGPEKNGEKRVQIEKQVKKLLREMTVEEKVGQMTQITLQPFAKEDVDGHLLLDAEKLREGIVQYHIGSILNCAGQARSVQNWHEIITQIQDIATKETRLGIPIIYGIDSIHGANYILNATVFPQNIAMAATGNVDLMQEIGEITALETRAAGIPWNFSPVLGLGRQPRWSRLFETFGEDAYIASVMGAAYIRGQQAGDISSPTKVATCMKHYLGYSVPLSGNDRTPAYIPERRLRQLFLKPFAAAVEAGTATCMVNSSEINGIPVHASEFYLIDLLRGELGFEGFVVSDWADIENLYTREMVAHDRREAVKMAVMAGVDMSMVPYDYSFYETLLELVNDGEVPMTRIDEAVADILRVKYRLALFERPYPNENVAYGVGSDTARQVNLQAAREAITLLKNDDQLLPLSKDAKVLVTGPCADLLSVLNSGWTITWQGDKEELYPQEKHTILEAIREKVGENNVLYFPGISFTEEIQTARAVSAAQEADVIVACIGEPPYCETPGNIDDLTMSDRQLAYIKSLAKAGKPIVLVLVEGRPRVIRTIVDNARAIVMAYLPGMEGGRAVADVLFGDVNPSGRLPITYPKFPGGFTLYDHKPSEVKPPNKYDPQWPFGYGLSYTTFAYRGLAVNKSEVTPADSIVVTVEVTNTGDRPGQDTVQLYLSDLVASVTPPVKQLKRFKKLSLRPGESESVRFVLNWDDLTFISRDNKPIVEPGEFKVHIGELSVSFDVPAAAK
jgi:beta-glucosidase